MPTFYAVAKGRTPGIYRSWDEAKLQVNKFSGAIHKSFKTEAEARAYVASHCDIPQPSESSIPQPRSSSTIVVVGAERDKSPAITSLLRSEPATCDHVNPVSSSDSPKDAETTPTVEVTAHSGAAGSKRRASVLPETTVSARSTRFGPRIDAPAEEVFIQATGPQPLRRMRSRWGFADEEDRAGNPHRHTGSRWGYVHDSDPADHRVT